VNSCPLLRLGTEGILVLGYRQLLILIFIFSLFLISYVIKTRISVTNYWSCMVLPMMTRK
jgi:hypothetical protein